MGIFDKKQHSKEFKSADDFDFIDLELEDSEELEEPAKVKVTHDKVIHDKVINDKVINDLYDFEEEAEEEEFYEEFEDSKEDQHLLNSLFKENQSQGFLQKMLERFTILDMVLGGMGIVLIITAIVVVSLVFSNKGYQQQMESIAQVGSKLSQLSTTGETELLVLAESTQVRIAEAEQLAKLQKEQEEAEAQAIQDALDKEKEEAEAEVTVVLSFTSVEKDLKIKITNKKTKKLIAGGDFAFEVTDPNGKTTTWNDHDSDGIIYKKELVAGTYKIIMKELEGYIVPTDTHKITVKDKIVFEKIDVADEVKTEAEVDVAKEDTVIKEPSVPALTDTVEFVASTATLRSEENFVYIETTKDKLVDPATLVAKNYTKLSSLYSTVDSITFTNKTGTVEEEKSIDAPIAVVGTIVTELADGLTVTSSDSTIATASLISDTKVQINGIKEGTATITVAHSSGKSDTFEITVTPKAVVVVPPITTVFAPTTLKLLTEATGTITATITNYTADAGLTFKSSDATIATVSAVNNADNTASTLTITGKKAGTANITAVGKVAGVDTVLATCVITVTQDPKTDTTTLLVTKDKKPVYVYNATTKTYTKATHSDYYKTGMKFYVVDETQQYVYTGWQTLNGKTYFFNKNNLAVTGEQIIQGLKYTFGGDGVLSSKVGSLGIDVSKWNGSINWTKVKNSGVGYVIIRCGYRGSSQGTLIEDPTYKANIQGAIAAGLKVGVYFYSQAINQVEAVEEASMVLNLIKGYTISYPVFIDIEASGGRADAIDKNTRTAVAQAFCETVQASGYAAGVYSGKNWFETKMNAASLEKYKIWVAHYNNATATTYKGRYDIWQYSSAGYIDGISGNVDLNLSYMGY